MLTLEQVQHSALFWIQVSHEIEKEERKEESIKFNKKINKKGEY